MNQVLEKTEKNESNLNIRKIVVAVDLSPHSEKTAAYAAQFAKSFGASMTLVHVFAPECVTEFTTQEEPITEFTSAQAHDRFEEAAGLWRRS